MIMASRNFTCAENKISQPRYPHVFAVRQLSVIVIVSVPLLVLLPCFVTVLLYIFFFHLSSHLATYTSVLNTPSVCVPLVIKYMVLLAHDADAIILRLSLLSLYMHLQQII